MCPLGDTSKSLLIAPQTGPTLPNSYNLIQSNQSKPHDLNFRLRHFSCSFYCLYELLKTHKLTSCVYIVSTVLRFHCPNRHNVTIVFKSNTTIQGSALPLPIILNNKNKYCLVQVKQSSQVFLTTVHSEIKQQTTIILQKCKQDRTAHKDSKNT